MTSGEARRRRMELKSGRFECFSKHRHRQLVTVTFILSLVRLQDALAVLEEFHIQTETLELARQHVEGFGDVDFLDTARP